MMEAKIENFNDSSEKINDEASTENAENIDEKNSENSEEKNDNSMEASERIVAELKKEFPKALRIATTVGGPENKIITDGQIEVGQEKIDVSIIGLNVEFKNSYDAQEFSKKLEELDSGIKSDIVGIDGINTYESESISLPKRRIFNVGCKLICPTELANKMF